MTRLPRTHRARPDDRLLDEDAWEAPRRLTDADLFNHGVDGRRRAAFDLEDPEDFR